MTHLSAAAPPRALLVWCLLTAATAAVVTLAVAAVHDALAGLLAAGPAPAFDDLLVGACAAVALVAAPWCWIVTTVLVLDAVRGRDRTPPGCPAALRRWVLAACGVAILSASAVPATASSGTPAGLAPGGSGDAGRSVVATAAVDRRDAAPVLDALPGALGGAARGVDGAPDTDDLADLLDGLPLPDRPGTDGPAAVPPAAAPTETSGTTAHHVVRAGDTLWAVAAAGLPRDAAAADVLAATRRLHALNRDVVGDDPDLVLPGQRLRLAVPPVPRA